MPTIYQKVDAPEGGDTFRPSDIVQQSFAEREALGATGSLTGTATSYWDASRGVQVYASPDTNQNAYFELYSGGGVRLREGPLPSTSTNAPTTPTSLFSQPTQGAPGGGTMPTPGFQEQQLGITPTEGKTIARTGRSGKNPATGVDVPVGPDEIFIEYTDGTFEIRKHGAIQQPGEAKPITESGKTAEELGITRQTEIKGGAGPEITRAPQTAAQVLQGMIDQGADPQAIDEFLQSEGESSTADLQLVGKTYRGRNAKEGYLFYVDPKTKEILERPEALQSIAQPLTIPGVAGTRIDVVDKFKAVFGRDPSAEELRYWMGRTDKVGAALIGAMQFAKQSGGAVGGTPAAPADPIEAMRTQANTSQERLAQSFSDQGITTRSDELRQRRAEIEALREPTGPSQVEFTREQLATSQLQEAMNDLNKSKAALRQLDADHLSNIEMAERVKGLSMGAIRRNLGELDIAYNRSRRDLVAEVEAHAEIVQSQTAIMGLMIDAFQSDRAFAQQEYANRLNKAMALYNMTAAEREFEFNVQEKYENTQRANLAVLTGLISEGRINYDNMSSEDKANIARMEQVAGLSGITQAIARTPMPPVVSIGTAITDENRNVRVPIYSQNPVTGEVSISYHTSPFKEKGPAGSGSSGTGDILGGLGGLLGGMFSQGNQGSDWVIETNETGASNASLEAPPMSGIPGTTMEYPQGSGTIWRANQRGEWE
jgi:hypothetical protein